MEFEKFDIEGPVLCKPKIKEDERGFFYESWNQIKFDEITNEKIFFLQDNVSRSKKGVLRGLHFQCNPNAQGKLVRCPIGEIFDDTNLRRKFINAMKETFELSKTFNVSFSKDPVETWLEKIEKM